MTVTRVYESIVRCPVQKLWDFHASVEAIKLLTPPDKQIEILCDDLEVREGALHVLKVRQFGVPIIWKARISDVVPPHGFTDTAEKSPFKVWLHRHDFLEEGDASRLRDTVTYAAPFGPIGALARGLFIDRDIDRMFKYRHEATKKALDGIT